MSTQNTDKQWMKRMLSHNVRMPMAVVTGYGELLRKGLLSAEEQETAIQAVCENITYMNDALRVVLEGDMEQEEHMEAVDLVLLLRRAETFVSEIARKAGIPISIQPQRPQMLVQASYFSLLRVFYQIFENAFKYLEFGNSVVIQIYDAGEEILIVYKDTGKGLPAKEKKSIFDKGFRGSNSKGKAGSGYGLHDLQQVIERMEGTVKVSSEKGKGLSIYITLPVYREESEMNE